MSLSSRKSLLKTCPRPGTDRINSCSDPDPSSAGAEIGPGMLGRLMELPGVRLSRHQLKRLEDHRYSSSGKSLLEPCIQPFWCWLVGQVPLWMAPNLITIVGLAVNVITTLILVYHCPTATEQVLLTTHLSMAVQT